MWNIECVKSVGKMVVRGIDENGIVRIGSLWLRDSLLMNG